VVDVITAAKRDLKAGETIDAIGFYMTYGLVENAPVTLKENLLPNGLAEGCVLTRDVPKDQVITYDDVEVPEGRLADALRAEQTRLFASELGVVGSAA
jgi:predicted homoserine dehydrogenase-like protein